MGELRIELGATLLVQVTQPVRVKDTPPESVETCPHRLSAHAASTYRPEAHPRGTYSGALIRQNAPSYVHTGGPHEGRC